MSIAERLRSRGLSPKKRFGQNFLVDVSASRAIAEAATTPPGGTVLEIGPGLGALTRPLLERAAKIVAIERDRDLVPLLSAELEAPIAEGRVSILEADALAVDWAAELVGPRPHVLAGNLPYQITGALLERATGLADRIDRAVFMVQAEVADRLVAPPGSKTYGALTVFVQAAFDVKRLLTVRGGAFYPRPDVDSAVVVLAPHRPARAVETDAFREAVRSAFGARRKTLRNAWRGLYGWSKDDLEARAREAGISLDVRGETLAVEDFARIAAMKG
ncbi:16S rRNA (adenine(1518)-N(6)/adenine(1519)-N(6))-dimethyltransferase RsmA [Polyangium fumosum]|uniref:Ribosomal RNA small subunit methyltransferase A n=1 Tax=Polyangium fumosum TaxID=889272 RepID=A0A4U1JAD3_9BACT|nr:16S rRNA (adenine(1518)-N(6)/adenine(1519)-N(6))-dimethyltransferase RsmA [Polyangium fumosum]TKD06269.1 ribosomal RNA small subunit methyltransferase A [Polyangium fumosum]